MTHQVLNRAGLTATTSYVVDRANLGNGVGYLLAGSFALGTAGYLFADRLASALPSALSTSSRADCQCENKR